MAPDLGDVEVVAEGGGAQWEFKWRRGHIERRVPNGKNWAPADWGNVIADVVAGRGWQAGAELSWEDTSWPAAARIPGGRWKCRLKDEYVHDGVRIASPRKARSSGMNLTGR